MSVLLVDVETTGLDPEVDRITEIGVMVTSPDFLEVVHTFNTLTWDESFPALTKEISDITGITPAMIEEDAITPMDAFSIISDILNSHDITGVVAYNAAFDKSFFEKEMRRQGWNFKLPQWVCAMADNKANYKSKSWKLMHVALDHGVSVNPSELHRAIADVELMRKMLVASKASYESLHEYNISPWVYLKAKVKKPWEDHGVSTTQAKNHGFSWEKAKGDTRIFDKMWVKRIKECDLNEQKALPFETIRIGESNANIST